MRNDWWKTLFKIKPTSSWRYSIYNSKWDCIEKNLKYYFSNPSELQWWLDQSDFNESNVKNELDYLYNEKYFSNNDIDFSESEFESEVKILDDKIRMNRDKANDIMDSNETKWKIIWFAWTMWWAAWWIAWATMLLWPAWFVISAATLIVWMPIWWLIYQQKTWRSLDSVLDNAYRRLWKSFDFFSFKLRKLNKNHNELLNEKRKLKNKLIEAKNQSIELD